MLNIQSFPFNPFQTNTYIISDENKNAVVIDPSFVHPHEREVFDNYIQKNELKLVGAYNTHLHFDHCLGTQYIKDKYGLEYAAHKDGLLFLESAIKQAAFYGLDITGVYPPASYLTEGSLIKHGDIELRIIYTPGHADGSVCFVSDSDKFVITGDVLFRESIGRTDLPTGDLDLLLGSIHNKLFKLDGAYRVYPGHGPSTTIAEEITGNPFLKFGEIH